MSEIIGYYCQILSDNDYFLCKILLHISISDIISTAADHAVRCAELCSTILIDSRAFLRFGGGVVKYRYRLPSEIKAVAEWQLQRYPQDKAQLANLDVVNAPISRYGGTAVHHSGTSRPTEDTALLMVSTPYILRMETGVKAVDRALSDADQTDRALVDMVFWKQSHNVEGAALAAHIAKSAAFVRINTILGAVAYWMGYLSPEERRA